MPKGLEDVSKYPNLFAALLTDPDQPWTEEELGKLASGNVIRVLGDIEKVWKPPTHEDFPEKSYINFLRFGTLSKE